MIISTSLRIKIERKISSLKTEKEGLQEYLLNFEREDMSINLSSHISNCWRDLSPDMQKKNIEASIEVTQRFIDLLNDVLLGKVDISKSGVKRGKKIIEKYKKTISVLEADISKVNSIRLLLKLKP